MKCLDRYKHRNSDFRSGYDKGVADGISIAIKVLMYQVIQYLGDKRGWTRESIFKALMWMHKHSEMLLEELTTFDEVVEAVKEEYGIIYEDGAFKLIDE